MRAVVAAFVVLFAGCLAAGPTDPSGTPVPSSEAGPIAAPSVDAAATLRDLRTFTEAHPGRQYETQTHRDSRTWLASAMTGAGLEVVRQKFPVSGAGPTGAYGGENVIGIHWGERRDEWIVVGAHYDVTDLAVHGAYDDGSGTILTVKLAQAFANVPSDRTYAFVLFDQEERGLLGSTHFVKSLQQGTFAHPAEVVAMVDLDMVGITHPHPAPLVCQENSDEIRGLVEQVRIAARLPDDKMQYRAPRGGTSDGAVFMRAGIPTLYCWSNWDEVVLKDGTRVQGSYPWWHRADTYATMVAAAGDETTLQAGFQTVLDVVSPVLARIGQAAFVPDTRA